MIEIFLSNAAKKICNFSLDFANCSQRACLSQRREQRFFLGVFRTCIQTRTFAWPSKFPRICGSFSKSFCPMFFLLKFLHSQASYLLFVPTIYFGQSGHGKYIYLSFSAFDKHPWGNWLNSVEAVREKWHIKPLRWSFRDPLDRSKYTATVF